MSGGVWAEWTVWWVGGWMMYAKDFCQQAADEGSEGSLPLI